MIELERSRAESTGLTKTEIDVGVLSHQVWEAKPNGHGRAERDALLRALAQMIADRPGALEALERVQAEKSIPGTNADARVGRLEDLANRVKIPVFRTRNFLKEMLKTYA